MAFIRWINVPVTAIIIYAMSKLLSTYVKGDLIVFATNAALVIVGFIWVITIWMVTKLLRNTIGRIPFIG